MSDEKLVVVGEDGPKEFNPPKDWQPVPPPAVDDEEKILRELFGEPDKKGVYAPYIDPEVEL